MNTKHNRSFPSSRPVGGLFVTLILVAAPGLALAQPVDPPRTTGDATPPVARPVDPPRATTDATPPRTPPRDARPADPRAADPRATPARPAVPAKPAAPAKKPERTQGWFYKLSLGVSFSMVHNYQVPGVDDGIALTLGGIVQGEVKFVENMNVWTAALKVVHTESKTPTIKPFLKTADELDLRTAYERKMPKFKKLSIYAGLQLVAPLFPADLVANKDTDLILNRLDGTLVNDFTLANKKYHLTDAFSPMVFKQMVGASLIPMEQALANMTVKLALAGQEVWAGGFTVADDKTTPALELKELQDFKQFGLQIEVELGGKVAPQLAYAFRLELMLPFYTDIDTGKLGGFDLMNADLTFKLGLKLSSWASLDYLFSAKRMPLIVNQWQVVNNLVLSITANIL